MEDATKSCRRPPKSERRVHFADSLGMDLVSIFLIDFLKLLHQNLQHQNQLQYHKEEPHSHPQTKQKTLTTNEQLLQQQQQLKQQQQQQRLLKQQQQNQYQYQYQQQQQLQQQQQYNRNQIQPINKQQSNQIINSSSSTTINNNYNNRDNNNCYKPPQTICQFTQPISLISFKERVRLNKVHLETCQVESRSAGLISVSCSIRVLNLAYEKAVVVRYTSDEWYTHTDVQATYRNDSNDGSSDKFICNFNAPIKGKRMLLAIQYIYGAEKTTCWDNNGSFNYTIQILE